MLTRACRHGRQGIVTLVESALQLQYNQDVKDLNDYFPVVVEELLHKTTVSNASNNSSKLLQYSFGGKLLRATASFNVMRELTGFTTDEEMRVSKALAWSIELSHAALLMLDDIADDAITRRGLPCWHVQVGLRAVLDALFLQHCAVSIIETHFKGEPYLDMLKLFQNTMFEASIGQNYDIHCTNSGVIKFDEFSLQRFRDLCLHKTSHYSFYYPIAMAMFACGLTDKSVHNAARDLASHIGLTFQIQDDFLDCYGSSKRTGKQGTDIRNGKCTWLIAKAKQMADQKQLKALKENYGFNDRRRVDTILQLYDELKITEAFLLEERQLVQTIKDKIKTHSTILPPSIYKYVLENIKYNLKR
ncbi:farnesyl pyrophosphate synthase-like [Frankliniella occidentalis]|uniref:Farnesyl pyrophosphate synthase n=1 Tax=Frankliniella occidentalis TaxID=133901 RepID=A0A9C6XS56_FRAOC|nr:farnesyl pyrophosphate synthase-like [Frankliniella occidentalis]